LFDEGAKPDQPTLMEKLPLMLVYQELRTFYTQKSINLQD